MKTKIPPTGGRSLPADEAARELAEMLREVRFSGAYGPFLQGRYSRILVDPSWNEDETIRVLVQCNVMPGLDVPVAGMPVFVIQEGAGAVSHVVFLDAGGRGVLPKASPAKYRFVASEMWRRFPVAMPPLADWLPNYVEELTLESPDGNVYAEFGRRKGSPFAVTATSDPPRKGQFVYAFSSLKTGEKLHAGILRVAERVELDLAADPPDRLEFACCFVGEGDSEECPV